MEVVYFVSSLEGKEEKPFSRRINGETKQHWRDGVLKGDEGEQ